MRKWFPLSASELLGIAGAASLAFTLLKESGSSGRIAAGLAVLTFLAVSILWGISRLWRFEGDRFQLSFEKKGAETLPHIATSSNLILVTHFGTLVPSDVYIAHMLEKMDQGVHVIRIVGDNANDERTQQWLRRFSAHERYSEYCLSKVFMPFDFAICDGRVLVLYLPSNAERSEFNQALVFKNQEIALIFRGIFEHLKKKGQQTPSAR